MKNNKIKIIAKNVLKYEVEAINNLKKSNIELDRKTLSLLAYNDFEAFEKIVQESSSNSG